MKRNLFVYMSALLLLLAVMNGEAEARQLDPAKSPQLGIWFGPVAPIYTTRKTVDTNLGGGLYARYNIFQTQFKLGADVSYQKYKSRGVNSLRIIPVYGSVIYRLPIKMLLFFNLKAGAGQAHVKAMPLNKSQWDPCFTGGGEVGFPVGSMANLCLRVEYLMVYEKYISGAKRNGHFLNTGLSVNFNMDMFR
jgi:hypothetical protein